MENKEKATHLLLCFFMINAKIGFIIICCSYYDMSQRVLRSRNASDNTELNRDRLHNSFDDVNKHKLQTRHENVAHFRNHLELINTFFLKCENSMTVIFFIANMSLKSKADEL